MRFIWDPRKARANFRKHRVSFDEACTVFGDAFAITVPDQAHSELERRFVTVGVSSPQTRLLVVCHTEEVNLYRIINARLATAHERKQYEG